MSEEPVVKFAKHGEHIAIVTLNRPDKRNAVNSELTQALWGCVRQVEDDKSIWVAILASSQDKVFCAGADLAEISSKGPMGLMHPEGGFAGFVSAKRNKPWIAAAAGIMVAGGLELGLACDMRVIGESSELGLPEVKRGLIASAGGITRLPRQIPRAIALEMIATGDRIPAKRAYELGLVNRVAADDQVLAEAIRLAEAITVNAPVAVREAFTVARQAADLSDAEALRVGSEASRRVAQTKDFQEGPRAFVEKRAPKWTGE